MSIEDKLKEYILTRFKSIREFVAYANLPYSTMDGILKRGIKNSSIGNIIKICEALNISADGLALGKIIPTNGAKRQVFISELPRMIDYMEKNSDDYGITIDDEPLTKSELETLFNSMTLAVEFIRNSRRD